MGSVDVIDDVNALLKLGVGDPYRLEHIKQAYILNSTIWKSDVRYLEQMREKYLVKHRPEQHDVESDIDENLEIDSENKNMIHCWKCGKKSLFEANFCMVCGSSLFEVGTESQAVDVQMPSVHSKNQRKPIKLKIPIMIGIPVLILVILGVGFSQGFFDNVLESQVLDDSVKNEIDSSDDIISSAETNSKCGAGTIFDSETNSCILSSQVLDDSVKNEIDSSDDIISSAETNSKCGAGTIFDSETNSCILDK